MSWRSDRTLHLACLTLVWAANCSVFPDEATLPEQDQVGSAGTPTVPLGGAGGQSVVVEDAGAAGEETPVAGAPANGGASAMGGAAMGGTGGTSNGGTPSGGTPSGGTPNGGTGGTPNGGTGGTSTCIHPQSSQIPVDADTWIEQAKSSATHGDDPQLFVVGGNAEERALLSFTVPAPPNGTALHHASLRLHLEGNADSSLAARRLAVCDLTRGFNEARATWTNYDKSGGAKWSIAGGDIGGELAAVMLARSTSNGSVTFDVTQALAAFSDNGAFSLPLIVLDKTSPARPAPAELAFTSAQGTAAQRPALLLEYCDR